MTNFIKRHLIDKIYQQVKDKQSILKHEHFFFFDNPIQISDRDSNKSIRNKQIDRINRWNPYLKEEVLPTSYYTLSGDLLVQIFKKLKSNQFFIYKKHNDKSYKMRIKDANRI